MLIVIELTHTGRDLFPGSDCLRWGDRKALLQAEMETHAQSDVICLQVSFHLSVTALTAGMR